MAIWACPVACRRLIAPPQFKDDAHLYNRDLIQLYNVSLKTIVRWRKELGIVVQHNQFTAGHTINGKRNSRGLLGPVIRNKNAPRQILPEAPVTITARAQRHLQRAGFIPVVKLCVIDSKADKNIWLVGSRKMTSGEMIDLAEEKGFEPEAWREFSTIASPSISNRPITSQVGAH